MRKPLLVGESNPYQKTDEEARAFALYPDPPRSAGGRLCFNILGMNPRAYLSIFDRTNLCGVKWSTKEARARAEELLDKRAGGVIVLFGAKVAKAFWRDWQFEPFKVDRFEDGTIVVQLPHPSGRNHMWNAPGSRERARTVLREAGVPI